MKKIVLTAGHSNTDPGAVGSGVQEAKLATQLRDITATKLRALGYEVIEDGEDGDNKDLNAAIALIKQYKPVVAVEIHFNASSSASATGVETIALPKDKALAQSISQGIATALGDKVRGDKGWIDQSQSARGRLGYINAGGLIVEVAFVSNKEDMAEYQAKYYLVATALADAIHKHLG